MQLLNDRSLSIRQAIHDVNITLLLTIALVILVILLFLRNLRATLIPALSVPVSLLGAFALMYLLGMSLDNISLMGLTIAVGLVVDDAIVVLENIMRYREEGSLHGGRRCWAFAKWHLPSSQYRCRWWRSLFRFS